jgi:membrane protease subunit (stomatin/prohibitin family)
MKNHIAKIIESATGAEDKSVSGRKIASVISSFRTDTDGNRAYQSDLGNEAFIWKHPNTEFFTGSQLIVQENEEALFFMNGQALDLFVAGLYTLETQNLPLVKKFFAAPQGGVTPFQCHVYFINKAEQLAIKWGTDSKVEYIEPTFGFPVQIGAGGEMALRVEDSRKLLIKIVGTDTGITQESFVRKMRGFLMTRIKNHLALYIKTNKLNIFEIDEHLLGLSEALHDYFRPDFINYGIAMERFFVDRIIKPEEDVNYRHFKELHFRQYADIAEAKLRQEKGLIDQETLKQKMILEAEGMATKRQLEGYTYQDERGFDVATHVAQNEAVGQMTNMGMGVGMMAGVGMGVGGAVGSAVGGMVQNVMGNALNPQEQTPPTQPNTIPCVKCGNQLPVNSKFCLECGQAVLGENEIICPSCNVKTPKGKFCLECGTSMVKKCAKCNTELPPSGKFCLECGEKL